MVVFKKGIMVSKYKYLPTKYWQVWPVDRLTAFIFVKISFIIDPKFMNA